MRRPACPCGRDCEARTITCKFDGTCDKYHEYEKEVTKYRELVKSNRARERMASMSDIDRALDIKEGKRR